MKNHLDILIQASTSEGLGRYHEIRLIIDGRDLIDLVREHEASLGATSPGDYAGLPAEHYSKTHFLGQRLHQLPYDDGRFELLDHPCGVAGCWPLKVRIQLRPDTVIWKAFQQPHRTGELGTEVWDYSDFGSFEFDREMYEEELAKIERYSHLKE